jgi:hypothetical protein
VGKIKLAARSRQRTVILHGGKTEFVSDFYGIEFSGD